MRETTVHKHASGEWHRLSDWGLCSAIWWRRRVEPGIDTPDQTVDLARPLRERLTGTIGLRLDGQSDLSVYHTRIHLTRSVVVDVTTTEVTELQREDNPAPSGSTALHEPSARQLAKFGSVRQMVSIG